MICLLGTYPIKIITYRFLLYVNIFFFNLVLGTLPMLDLFFKWLLYIITKKNQKMNIIPSFETRILSKFCLLRYLQDEKFLSRYVTIQFGRQSEVFIVLNFGILRSVFTCVFLPILYHEAQYTTAVTNFNVSIMNDCTKKLNSSTERNQSRRSQVGYGQIHGVKRTITSGCSIISVRRLSLYGGQFYVLNYADCLG